MRYQLAATLEAAQATDSIVVFVHIDRHTSRAFIPGEEVKINVKLERVKRGRVIVRNGTRQEYIDTATPPAPALAVRSMNRNSKQQMKYWAFTPNCAGLRD